MMKRLMRVVVAVTALILVMPMNVFAGVDVLQQQMRARLAEAKKKHEEAERATAAERQKLMQEHMQMMEENMKMMQTMKPKAGMTMQEHEEWIAEHQKLMDQMLEQMMKDQHMMTHPAK